MKIIESSGTRSVTDRKTGNDGMQMILFEVSSKSGIGSYFKFDRNKNGPQHIGRESWFRTKDRITILHKVIYS